MNEHIEALFGLVVMLVASIVGLGVVLCGLVALLGLLWRLMLWTAQFVQWVAG